MFHCWLNQSSETFQTYQSFHFYCIKILYLKNFTISCRCIKHEKLGENLPPVIMISEKSCKAYNCQLFRILRTIQYNHSGHSDILGILFICNQDTEHDVTFLKSRNVMCNSFQRIHTSVKTISMESHYISSYTVYSASFFFQKIFISLRDLIYLSNVYIHMHMCIHKPIYK